MALGPERKSHNFNAVLVTCNHQLAIVLSVVLYIIPLVFVFIHYHVLVLVPSTYSLIFYKASHHIYSQ